MQIEYWSSYWYRKRRWWILSWHLIGPFRQLTILGIRFTWFVEG